jgi:HEPN domain-containing protein
MASTADTYRAAANEHLERAQDEFDRGEYFLAHYLSGLAVECYLRALLRRRSDQFDSRHDLAALAVEDGYYDDVPLAKIDHYSTLFSSLNLRWRSNHRYYSNRQFLDYMNELGAEFNSKGNRWKNMSRTVLKNAYDIIKLGELKWT